MPNRRPGPAHHRWRPLWLLALAVGLAAWPAAVAAPDDQPQPPPAGDSANKDSNIGAETPAEAPRPGGPQPPTSPGAANAEPQPLPQPPEDAKGAREPEGLAPAKPAGERKRAYIYVLDPTSVVKTKGPENSVVARGRLQMVIPDDEVILLCNAVDYSGETTGIATLTGDLKILTGKIAKDQTGLDTIPQPETVVTGDVAYVFTKEKRAVIDGNVVVVHTPAEPAPADADEAEQARHDPTTLYCDRLTFWYRKGDRKAVAQARLPKTKIRFEQKTRRGTAGMATYYDFEAGESETGDVLDLVGGVYGEDDDGQVIEAEVCRLLVDDDSSQWYNVKRVVVNLEEDEQPSTAPPGPPPVPENTPTPAP